MTRARDSTHVDTVGEKSGPVALTWAVRPGMQHHEPDICDLISPRRGRLSPRPALPAAASPGARLSPRPGRRRRREPLRGLDPQRQVDLVVQRDAVVADPGDL